MNAQEQAKILVARYYYLTTSLMTKDQQNELYDSIVFVSKEMALFAASQAQKSTDIRGFNFWQDVIEYIEILSL